MLPPGHLIERYRIEALLGEGGMGAVYIALDTRLQRRVALKIVRLALGTDAPSEESAARLVREARAAAAIQHPNAVAVYDVGGRPRNRRVARNCSPKTRLAASPSSTASGS